MERLANFLLVTIAVVGCCALFGCGSSDGLVPVEGVVTFDGKPLAEAAVVLHPVTASGPGPFTGITNADGKFSLGPSSSPGQGGVIPGEYRLSISTLKVVPTPEADDAAKPEILAPEIVPEIYRLGNMRFEVPNDGTHEANFDLSSRR